MKEIVENSENQSLDGAFVVFDIETTGFSPAKNKIIEIGAVRVENGVITDRIDDFVNPEVPIPFEIEQLTGINDAMVMGSRDHRARSCRGFWSFAGERCWWPTMRPLTWALSATTAARSGI